jgi:hypothetical protein
LITLSEDRYSEEEKLKADFSIKQIALDEYSKDIENRLTRIDCIRKVYSSTDFNAPIYELAFKELLEKKEYYRKDFVVPFTNSLEQDLALTPNGNVKLISFSKSNFVYNTKNLKEGDLFFNYGPNTGKVVSLYISKDGHFGFLLRFNKNYYYESGESNYDKGTVINDGKFMGEAYEGTLVNLIMFFSSVIRNKETNIITTIEQIAENNSSSTIAHVYRSTKENLENIENIDKEFTEALANTKIGKRTKIDSIDSLKNSINNEILAISFDELQQGEGRYYSGRKNPAIRYSLEINSGREEKNFLLYYLNAYKTTYADNTLLIPAVVKIKNEKMYLLYAIDKNKMPINASLFYSNPKTVEGNFITVAGMKFELIEYKEYFSILKNKVFLATSSANPNSTGKQGGADYYYRELEAFHKDISLNFITKLKSSKRKISLIENKLTPYEYKLKIINVLRDILIKAFTSEIFIKKI